MSHYLTLMTVQFPRFSSFSVMAPHKFVIKVSGLFVLIVLKNVSVLDAQT